MTITVRHLNGVSFEAETRGHKIICDQPESNGGADTGMTPPEFLLASLATCAGYYALQYLKTRNLPTEGLKVTVDADKATQPARLGRFRIVLDVPGLEDPRHQEGLIRSAQSCIIHNTLLNAPSIDVILESSPVSLENPGSIPNQFNNLRLAEPRP